MSNPMRLDADLVREAELEGKLQKRTTPKQIEYWAQLGRLLAREVTNAGDILALMQGFAKVEVQLKTPVVDLDSGTLLASVEAMRRAGTLSAAVSQAPVRYAASTEYPGLLEEVTPDGQRRPGRFIEGRFVPSSRA